MGRGGGAGGEGGRGEQDFRRFVGYSLGAGRGSGTSGDMQCASVWSALESGSECVLMVDEDCGQICQQPHVLGVNVWTLRSYIQTCFHWSV